MRRFTVISVVFTAAILAAWGVFEVFAASPSGTASANEPMVGADMKIAPVFDVTGAIISDPTGTMVNSNQSGASAVPLTGRDMKVAARVRCDGCGRIRSNGHAVDREPTRKFVGSSDGHEHEDCSRVRCHGRGRVRSHGYDVERRTNQEIW